MLNWSLAELAVTIPFVVTVSSGITNSKEASRSNVTAVSRRSSLQPASLPRAKGSADGMLVEVEIAAGDTEEVTAFEAGA
jgi:hypothetical protein